MLLINLPPSASQPPFLLTQLSHHGVRAVNTGIQKQSQIRSLNSIETSASQLDVRPLKIAKGCETAVLERRLSYIL